MFVVLLLALYPNTLLNRENDMSMIYTASGAGRIYLYIFFPRNVFYGFKLVVDASHVKTLLRLLTFAKKRDILLLIYYISWWLVDPIT